MWEAVKRRKAPFWVNIKRIHMALSENSVVGPRESDFFFGCIRLLAQPRFGQRKLLFSPGKDADLSAIALAKAGAGDVDFIVDAARWTTLLPLCSPCCDSSIELLRTRAARSQIEFSDTA